MQGSGYAYSVEDDITRLAVRKWTSSERPVQLPRFHICVITKPRRPDGVDGDSVASYHVEGNALSITRWRLRDERRKKIGNVEAEPNPFQKAYEARRTLQFQSNRTIDVEMDDAATYDGADDPNEEEPYYG
jgi:hypothetical protein